MDGYMAPLDKNEGWLNIEWTPDLKDYMVDLMVSVDRIILGRNVGMEFIPHWLAKPTWMPRPAGEEPVGLDKINGCHKTVFSKTLKKEPVGWSEHDRVFSGDLKEEVLRMKGEQGKGDIIAYGGVDFVRSLVGKNLVDELYLIISPVTLGAGSAVFPKKTAWKLAEVKPSQCRLVVLHYSASV